MSERDLPEGVIDADPPGGWDGVDDLETKEQNADAAGQADLVDAPVDVVQSEVPSQGTDPDLGVEER
jgi:hypothetical protein